jgi:hypothetical protein
MKTKLFLFALLALMSFAWISCNKKDEAPKEPPSSTTELDGTQWEGTLDSISLKLSFVENRCYLTTNLPETAADGTYATKNSSKVYIVIKNVTGDRGIGMYKGTLIIGTYDLTEKTLTFNLVVEGTPVTVIFNQVLTN